MCFRERERAREHDPFSVEYLGIDIMSDSLLSGVSGLQASQEMLDVVGNNLANASTTGYKEQNVLFQDVYYQTLQQGAGAPTGGTGGGGTNPIQVGSGVQVAAIDTNLQQGTLEQTGNNLDLAIQGKGYFVVNDGTQNLYTRAGAFTVNSNNVLVDTATGDAIQRFGNVGEATATSQGFQIAGNSNIQVPLGTGIPARATATVDLQGNLNASAAGPQAETLTTSQPFTTTAVVNNVTTTSPATAATFLDSLDGNSGPYQAGDSILISGTDANGNPVSASFDPVANSTLGDLVSAISGAFSGATASLANGNIMLQSNTTGPASLSLSLADSSTNQGGSDFGAHGFSTTTTGSNGTDVNTSIQVFDSQGTAHTLSLTLQKQANNTWNLTSSVDPSDGSVINGSVNNIRFNDDGSLQQVNGSGTGTAQISVQFNGLSTPQNIDLSFGVPSGFGGLTQFTGTSTGAATNQDGYTAGVLTNVAVDQGGIINGVFSNGQTLPIAQLALATFTNPGGLSRAGNNYSIATTSSGAAQVGAASTGGLGSIQAGALESSNVDISEQFTQLITAQRNYEVNSRTITVASQLMQDLANIIH
jgi:flagellar hook protein FlgE